MTSPTWLPERDRAFGMNLAALRNAQDSRAALAILRRSFGSSARFEAIRVLDRVIPWGTPDHDVDAYALVAGLCAAYEHGHPVAGAPGGDMGDSFGRLARHPGWDADRAGRRLGQLFASDAEALPERLRHTVSLLRSVDVPIDWASLAHDVRGWDRAEFPVQRRWARSFVRASRAPDQEDGSVPQDNQGDAS